MPRAMPPCSSGSVLMASVGASELRHAAAALWCGRSENSAGQPRWTRLWLKIEAPVPRGRRGSRASNAEMRLSYAAMFKRSRVRSPVALLPSSSCAAGGLNQADRKVFSSCRC